LASRRAGVHAATTREQELARPLVRSLQIIINGLTGLFAQFKSDRLSGLLLSDGCAFRRVATGSDIFDPDGDDVAPSKLAVDGEIRHGEVANAAFNLEFRPD
jgi:hypothetical protein